MNKYIRLRLINTNEMETYEHIMKAKVASNNTLSENKKDRLYQVLINNKKDV